MTKNIFEGIFMGYILSNSEINTLIGLLNKIASQSLDKRVLTFNTACCSVKFQYPIDEEKLDELAKKETGCLDPTNVDDPNYTGYHCYVAGYRKAKEG